MRCVCVKRFLGSFRRGGNGGARVPMSYFATATGPGIVDSVGRCFFGAGGLVLRGCAASSAEAGLECAMLCGRGSGRGCGRVECLLRRGTYPAVVCISEAGATRELTRRLVTSNFGTGKFRNRVSGRVGVEGRRSFVRGGFRIVITASTFKVNISGDSINLIVRCRVSSSLRGCVRRTNETNQSVGSRTRYCILCGSSSLGGRFVLLGRAGLALDRVGRI